MQVTVTGLYDGSAPLVSLGARPPACPAAIALPPGSEVILKATFGSTGEACLSPDYIPESITAPDYSTNRQMAASVSYAAGDCTGIAENFDLHPFETNQNVSFYAGPQQDGGASWVLAVDFFPDPDAGACNVNSSCTELYVGHNQKL